MNQTGADSGTEFVLDNRKLIITFLVLVVVCGAFFVIGFMEGKRQAVPTRVERTPSDPAAGTEAQARGPDAKAADRPTESTPIEDRSGSAQLDWYQERPGQGIREPRSRARPPKSPNRRQHRRQRNRPFRSRKPPKGRRPRSGIHGAGRQRHLHGAGGSVQAAAGGRYQGSGPQGQRVCCA